MSSSGNDLARRLVLMLGGDVMTGRGIDQVLMHPAAPALYEAYVRDARDYVDLATRANGAIPRPVAPDYLWGDALAEMNRMAPDLRIVNLETAITTASDHWPGKGIHYRMHPANIACLSVARLDACVVANNHVLDWGRAGLAETLQTLRETGIQTAGAGAHGDEAWAPARLPMPGGKGHVLLFACAAASSGVPAGWAAGLGHSGVALLPDVSRATASQLARDVARWRSRGDVVIFSIHWGGNWGLAVPAAHRAFAHELVDLGAADVVHGHSSHHPMPVEVYRNKLILYGCGDLINDYEGIGTHAGFRSDLGCLYGVSLNAATGALERLDVSVFRMKRFRLGTADAADHQWLGQVFQSASPDLGPQPRLQAGGQWSLSGAEVPVRRGTGNAASRTRPRRRSLP